MIDKSKAIEKSCTVFSIEDRVIKTVEEFGELFQAISKFRSNPTNETAKGVMCEIADCRLALDQWEHRLIDFGLPKGGMEYIADRQFWKFERAVDNEANES